MHTLAVALVCLVLIASTTVIHYETLAQLNSGLPRLAIPARSKLLVVILAAFFAHALEVGAYGVGLYAVLHWMGIGGLSGPGGGSFGNCLYFSVETFSSLGFGDVVPVGAARMIAGVEALNGLLLIGWSASYAYIAMEKYWVGRDAG